MNERHYEVTVRAWTDRVITVRAIDEERAEEKAIKEIVALVGGFDPEVLATVQVEPTDDWPIDRADD